MEPYYYYLDKAVQRLAGFVTSMDGLRDREPLWMLVARLCDVDMADARRLCQDAGGDPEQVGVVRTGESD